MNDEAPCLLDAVHIPIQDYADVAEAGRNALLFAEACGFSKVLAYYIATAVIELGNNIMAHADSDGSIVLTSQFEDTRIVIEIIAEDRGPGIFDVDLALTDGYTTNNGLGCGLPGVARLMDELHIETSDQGTRIRARKRR